MNDFERKLQSAETNAELDHIEARRELGLRPDSIEREALISWHVERHGTEHNRRYRHDNTRNCGCVISPVRNTRSGVDS